LGLSSDQLKHVEGQDDVLATLYASASVFVYPSIYEGFGIPLLEAMNFGCPVVSANSSSLPEVVGDAAELFDSSDIDGLRVSIERVVTSDEVSRLLVNRGFERIKNFSWDKCMRETLKIYEKLASG